VVICTYCKRETINSSRCRINDPLTRTRDHVIPLSRGGLDTRVNRVISCLRCNSVKGSMMPDEWAAYMVANPMWWIKRPRPLPMEESLMILKFGKKVWRRWKFQQHVKAQLPYETDTTKDVI
jgi:hypothetical protein